jgi:hypothetical protein
MSSKKTYRTISSKSTKSTQPTKTVIKPKAPKPKLSLNEQLEADLKEMEAHEKAIKQVVREKGYKYKKITKYINSIFGNDDPNIKYIKNLKYNGKDLISIRINDNKYENRFYTIKKIKRLSEKLSNKLLKKGVQGKMMTSLLYGDLGWKSGYLKTFGEAIKLYDPNILYNMATPYDEPKEIKSFNIYIALGNRDIGGDDDFNNDCLYNCLKYYIFNIEDYFKSPAELKTFLKLKRNDKIPLSSIDQIENKLKNYQINIRGDFIRTSTINSNKQINITLSNEHYSVEKQTHKFLKFLKYNEKTPLLFDKKNMIVFDGSNKWEITKAEKHKIIYDYNSKYILINRQEPEKDEQGNKIEIPIEQEYKQFIEIADALKNESNGMINLYKTGSSHDTALNLFDRISKYIIPESILQDEAEWIDNSSFGAIIWAKQYTGELYKYDVKSLYPYIMTSSTLKFPVKRGEFKKIENFCEYIEFGIYRCIVNKSDDENINRLFRFNQDNYYSSIDIMNAKELNLNVELIQDDKPNFLFYSRDKLITFGEVFKTYVDLLFPLKENKVKMAKDILNILWGSLCEKDKRKKFIKDDFEIDEDDDILEIYPTINDDGHIVKTINRNNIYKTSFSRLCPFLTGQARRHMTKILLPYKDEVQRVQTDGFLITKPIHTNTNVKIGMLRYEGFTKNGIILNCINRVKTDI